jgi:hypothetical protein
MTESKKTDPAALKDLEDEGIVIQLQPGKWTPTKIAPKIIAKNEKRKG